MRELLTERIAHLSAEQEYELRHPDFVMEMPQSGERVRGRDDMLAFQRAFPQHGPVPVFTLRRVTGRDDLFVLEASGDYGGRIYHTAAAVELRDGKIWRETRYYGDPFEAPARRARWVERMEPMKA